MRGVLTIGIIGGLLYLGSRVMSAKKLSDKSVVRTLNPRIATISFSGITLSTDVYVDNPTNGSVQVSKPVITFTSGGKYIASSVPTRQMFTIAPMSQTSLGTIQVEIQWNVLTPYISNLVSRISALTQKNNVSFKALDMPLEYYYSVYVNDLYYESSPETLV
jgi:hypothetical protein